MREELAEGNILRGEGEFCRYGLSDGEIDEINEIANESDLYSVKCTLGGGGKLETIKAY